MLIPISHCLSVDNNSNCHQVFAGQTWLVWTHVCFHSALVPERNFTDNWQKQKKKELDALPVTQPTVSQHWNTHTHTRLTALFPGLPGWVGTRKVKPIWILLKQQTVSGSGISWAICKSAPHSRQIIMPAPYHSVFLQAGYPSCRPTNSVKALKANITALKQEKYYLSSP